MFFRTSLICILACLPVCVGLFFVVLVPIFCFETFLWCWGFPLRLCRIFWLFFCLVGGRRFVFCCFSCLAICGIFGGFFDSFCSCIFVWIIFSGIFESLRLLFSGQDWLSLGRWKVLLNSSIPNQYLYSLQSFLTPL